MIRKTDFFIDGRWVAPTKPHDFEVINPADENPYAVISLGGEADLDKAVAAARAAFPAWSQTDHAERVALLEKLAEIYARRSDEMAEAISTEMGAPIKLATNAQAAASKVPHNSGARLAWGTAASSSRWGSQRYSGSPLTSGDDHSASSGKLAPSGQNSGSTSTSRNTAMATTANSTPTPPAVISMVARRSRRCLVWCSEVIGEGSDIDLGPSVYSERLRQLHDTQMTTRPGPGISQGPSRGSSASPRACR